MQFADWCAPVKISNSAEYSVLQALRKNQITTYNKVQYYLEYTARFFLKYCFSEKKGRRVFRCLRISV
jgi:hypothetical protein